MLKTISSALIFLLTAIIAPRAQNKTLRTYYDPEKKIIKEEYRILDTDSSVLDGIYKTYYQNGKLKTVGFYTNNQATDFWQYFYESGKLKMEGLIHNFLQEGIWTYYYENGNKSMIGRMEKGKKQGYWTYYYENGAVKSEGVLRNGLQTGEWKYYHDDGTLKAVGIFDQGIGFYQEYYPDGGVKMQGIIKDGKSDSTWIYFHPNGKKKAIGTEEAGLKEGLWRFYDENEQLQSEGYYKKGIKDGKWTYYHPNGTISSQGEEKNGQKEGVWKMFYASGKPKGEALFQNGDGPYTEYYENGRLKVKGQMTKGKYDGIWTYYHEDGTLEGECVYNMGDGWYTGYYPDRTKKMEGALKDGVKQGVWKLYKPDGTLAGFYKTISDEEKILKVDSLLYKSAITSVPQPPTRLNNTPVKKSKPPEKHRLRIRLYKPNPNLYKTFILSAGVLSFLDGAFIPALEYYVQQSWGLEFSYFYQRLPLFANHERLAFNRLYRTANAFSFRYKRYFYDHDFIGLPYLAAEIRGLNRTFNTNFQDPILQKTIVLTSEHRALEILALGGDRFMQFFDRKGISLDLHFGLGIGIRQVSYNFDPARYSTRTFENIQTGTYYPAFRFGLNIGYAF